MEARFPDAHCDVNILLNDPGYQKFEEVYCTDNVLWELLKDRDETTVTTYNKMHAGYWIKVEWDWEHEAKVALLDEAIWRPKPQIHFQSSFDSQSLENDWEWIWTERSNESNGIESERLRLDLSFTIIGARLIEDEVRRRKNYSWENDTCIKAHLYI